MSMKSRLLELEKEAPIDIRVKEALVTNPEFLELSIESFLKKYESVVLMDRNKDESKLKKIFGNPNFRMMYTLYGSYFNANKKDLTSSIDLNMLSSIPNYNTAEQLFMRAVDGKNYEGIISPDGVFYPAIKSHYCLCSWLNLKGVDLRKYVRTVVVEPKACILFSELNDYIKIDVNKDFELTEQQVKAMNMLFKLVTHNSKFAAFHNSIETSYKYGFCNFSDIYKSRKQIELFEDVLGKKIIDSHEILSTKTKYY